MRTTTIAAALLAALAAAPAAARPDAAPARGPITLVVPFSTGTVMDIMARAFAEPFREALGGGAPVVVLNREGAAGSIGAAAVLQARPDGQTVAFAPSGMLTAQPFMMAGLPYRFEQAQPVCQVFENIFVVATGPRTPHRSLADVIAAARARPEAVTWGDAGPGTVGNLIVRELELRTGTRMVHVPYRAGGQMILDAASGALDFALTTWATVRGTELRTLAVAADERQPVAPDAPTLAELGFPINWRGFGGLWGPRGIPEPTLRRLEAACLSAVGSEAYRRMSENTGQVAAPLDAAGFGARLAAEHAEAGPVVQRLGLAAPGAQPAPQPVR